MSQTERKMPEWESNGIRVQAWTKSEARARLKQILSQHTGQPVTRLRVGTVVRRVA